MSNLRPVDIVIKTVETVFFKDNLFVIPEENKAIKRLSKLINFIFMLDMNSIINNHSLLDIAIRLKDESMIDRLANKNSSFTQSMTKNSSICLNDLVANLDLDFLKYLLDRLPKTTISLLCKSKTISDICFEHLDTLCFQKAAFKMVYDLKQSASVIVSAVAA